MRIVKIADRNKQNEINIIRNNLSGQLSLVNVSRVNAERLSQSNTPILLYM